MSSPRAEKIVPQSIRGRVLSLALLPLLISLIVSIVLFLLLITPEILNDQKEQLRQTTVAQREFFYQWREERFSDLRFLAALIADSQGPGQRQPPEAELFLNRQAEFTQIRLFGANGYAIDDQSESGVYVGDRPYFEQALSGREALSDILVGRLSRIPLIVFALPVPREDEQVRGVVLATVPIATLLDTLSASSQVARGETLLVDSEGRIMSDEVLMPLYESRSQPGVLPLELAWSRPGTRVSPAVMADIQRGVRTAGPYRNRNGELVVAAYASLVLGDWYLVGENPAELLFDSLRTYLLAGVATILIFLLLFLPLLLLVSRTIERPIMDLASFSREINRETYDTDTFPRLPQNAPKEIRTLFATFSEMVHRLQEHMRELEHTAITDPLSGLANRRFLLAEGRRAVTMCLEQKQPVSLLMVDIDYFKRINDELGHDVGDEAIRSAASTITAATRGTDLVARFGGEEFTVVAPFTNKKEAMALGERIRTSCAEIHAPPPAIARESDAEEGSSWFTVSLGVATTLPKENTGQPHDAAPKLLDSLMERADNALYRAKREGRNRVVAD